MKHRIAILCGIILLSCQTLMAQNEQENASNLGLGADIVSRYVWRGMPLSTSPAIQPYLEYSFGNLTIGSWGSYTFSNDTLQEVDLYLSYAINSFSITLNDYYNPNESGLFSNQYFEWNDKKTGHALELVLAWEGTESLPINLSAGIILYGNDKNEDTGDNYYSSYAELGYTLDLGGTSLAPFIGFTFSEGLYADKLNVVNLGASVEKEIEITDKFSLPIKGSFITNPASGDAFIVFGISF